MCLQKNKMSSRRALVNLWNTGLCLSPSPFVMFVFSVFGAYESRDTGMDRGDYVGGGGALL